MQGIIVFLGLLLGQNTLAQSGPSTINLTGTLFDHDGVAITDASVNFRLEVYDKSGACLLYSENHNGQDLSTTKGAFSVELGEGQTRANFVDSSSPGDISAKVYENSGTVAGGWTGCPTGATLADGDNRLIRVFYDLGGGMTRMDPDVPITAAAYAIVAQTLQGKRPSDFIQVHNDVTNKLSQANVENIFSSTNYPKLTDLLSGASTSYISSNPTSPVSFNNQTLTNVASPSSNADATNKGYVDSTIGGKTADFSGVGPATGDGYTLIWDKDTQTWTTGLPTATDNSKLPLAGGQMSGDIDMNGNKIVNTGHIVMSPLKTLTLGSFNNTQEAALVATLTAANAGASWYNSQSKLFKIWDGTAATSQSISGLAAGGDLTGTYPNPTIANDKILSAMIDSAGTGINRLVISDQTDGGSLEFATCATNQVLRWEDANGWICRDPSAIVSFPVTSVNGETGAVVLDANNLGLGTAALQNIGTHPGEIPVLDAGGKIPASFLPATGGAGDFMKDGSVAMTGNFNAGGHSILGNTTASANLLLESTSDSTKGFVLLQSNGGKVGIGTTAPGYALDVNGTINATSILVNGVAIGTPATSTDFDNGQGAHAYGDNNILNSMLIGPTANNTSGALWIMPTGSAASSYIHIAGSSDGTTHGTVAFEGGELWLGALSALPVSLRTDGVDRLTVDATGNIGIGTSTPSEKLQVDGNIKMTGTGNGITFPDGTTQTTAASGGGSSGPFILDSGSGEYYYGDDEVVHLSIGSTPESTTANLEVSGKQGILAIRDYDEASETNARAKLIFTTSDRNEIGSIGDTSSSSANITVNAVVGNVALVTTAAKPITFSTTNAERVRIDATGNVAIGTTSATQKLEVAGNIKMTGTGNGITFPDGTTQTTASSGGSSQWTTSSGNIYFNGGGVAIGTTSPPTSGLSVYTGSTTNGSLSLSGAGSKLLNFAVNTTAGNGNGLVKLSDAAIIYTNGGADTGALVIGPGSTGAHGIRMDSAGQVGIGTATPGRLLHVNGAARFTPTTTPLLPSAGDVFFDSANSNALKYYDGSAWQTVNTGASGGGGLTNFTEAANSSAPNATVPVVSFTATNAATNVDFALSPKGTGALSSQVANSAASGGNKRGQYAVDWQMGRTAATQVASGPQSVITGGMRNTASADFTTVGGGISNIASGYGASVGGGETNQATGTDAAIAGGSSNTASGSASTVAGGTSNTANSNQATVGGGIGNTASGNSSVVPGGTSNTASGNYSFAANNNTTAASYGQTTFGVYNLPKGSESASSWVATDPLFVIGNGTSTTKANALMILKNGNVGIGTTSPAQKLEVAGNIKMTGTGNGITFPDGTSQTTAASSGGGLIGKLKYAGASNCNWTSTSASWTNYTAQTNCSTPTVTGSATAPATKIPGITFANLPAGDYELIVTSQFYAYSAPASCRWSVYDGTSQEGLEVTNSQGESSATLISQFSYATAQTNITFQVQAIRVGGTGTCMISNDESASLAFTIWLKRI